jgi:hypothetical protein
MYWPTTEDYARVERDLRQFIKDNPWSGSAPGPYDIYSYDEISRRSVYSDSRGMKF